MDSPSSSRSPESIAFRSALIVLALVVTAVLTWWLHDILLLFFAAVLIAIMLRAAVSGVTRVTRLPNGMALAVVVALLAGAAGAAIWLFGAELAAQASELARILPAAWQDVETRLGDGEIGERVMEQLRGLMPDGSTVVSTFGMLFNTLTGILSGLLLILAGGIYLAAQPRYYRRGVLTLLPQQHRQRAGETIETTGRAIKLWLLGQLGAMVVVGIVIGIGLSIIGVPGAFALGLLAGLLEFVPFAGPILAAIPGLLIASTQGMDTLLWTALFYFIVQQLEGVVLTPLIQRRAVDLPPALTLFAVVALGGLFGVPGLLLAAPLTVVIYVAVKKLYIRETLEEETHVPGEK